MAEQEARSPGSFKNSQLEFLENGVNRKGVLLGPSVHFRGFSHTLELWKSSGLGDLVPSAS